MYVEERAFRRMVTETLVEGPDHLTGAEIHSTLGISPKMVAAARRKKVEKEKSSEKEKRATSDQGRPPKSRFVSSAMERRRKTSKYLEKRDLIQRFFEENSTPTSRRRDVIRIKVVF